jgi:hypothetical protein
MKSKLNKRIQTCYILIIILKNYVVRQLTFKIVWIKTECEMLKNIFEYPAE